jgi:hypothetical protein
MLRNSGSLKLLDPLQAIGAIAMLVKLWFATLRKIM